MPPQSSRKQIISIQTTNGDNAPAPRTLLQFYGIRHPDARTDAKGKITLSYERPRTNRRFWIMASTDTEVGWVRIKKDSKTPIVIVLRPLSKEVLTYKVYVWAVRWFHAFRYKRRVQILLGTLGCIFLWVLLEIGMVPVSFVQELWSKHSLHLICRWLNRDDVISTIDDLENWRLVPQESQQANETAYFNRTLGPGRHLVSKVITIPDHIRLDISPNARLLFADKAGLIVKGLLTADGQTSSTPIVFEAVEKDKGWLNISFIGSLGQKARCSAMSFCKIFDGRGAPYYAPSSKGAKSEEDFQKSEDRFERRSGEPPKGGGILVYQTSLHLSNCEFENNTASMGGALYIRRESDVRVEDCLFSKNSAVFPRGPDGYPKHHDAGGGAIYVHSSDLVLRNSTFKGNWAGDWATDWRDKISYSCGGAIYAGLLASCDIESTTFESNSADHVGGAVYALNIARLWSEVTSRIFTIEQCNFERNIASSGSAVYVDEGINATFANCRMLDNKCEIKLGAHNPYLGGTVVAHSQTPTNKAILSIDPATFEHQSNLVLIRPVENPSYQRIVFEGDFWEDSTIQDGIESVSANLGDLTRESKAHRHRSPIIYDVLMHEHSEITIRRDIIPESERSWTSTDKPRHIDTIVIHNVNAAGWFAEDFQNQFKPQVEEFEKEYDITPENIDAQTLDIEIVKKIFILYGVTSHYVIDQGGHIIQFAPTDSIAHHAGTSRMPDGRENVNNFSIGIELLGRRKDEVATSIRKGWEPYSDAQYNSLGHLVDYLTSIYPNIKYVVGHDEIAEGRKSDPGPDFHWERIRQNNLTPIHH